ncbi:MAG: membrane protein insertion efficiency factor YidD [Thermodesulfobacteriota bacterium]
MAHQIITDSFPIFSLAILFFAVLSSLAIPSSAASLNGPWGWDTEQEASPRNDDQCSSPLQFMVKLHRKYISPIDGKNCPMHPSCSRYSLQCLETHGLFIGWLMTCDRLMRCGRDELRLCPEIRVNDELLCYDPLKNNDFWWYHEH